MKKLMTIFASVATLCAVGVAKGELTTTGFEEDGANPAYVAGQSLNTAKDDAGLTSVDGAFAATWVNVEPLDDGAAVISNWYGETIPENYDKPIGEQYLKLDSGSQVISRYAQKGGEAYEIPSEGIYIDTLVKFTPSEDTEPETTAGDKLCIWVNVDEETGATNLMVKAGYIEDDMGTTVPTNYVVTGAFQGENLDGWHRLTVIAYTSIDEDEWLASGFAIKIDGNLVGTELCPFADASTYIFKENVAAYMASSPYKLFPSLVSLADDDSTSLTSIGFKGSGSIDNVQFTPTDPIQPPPGGAYELTITATDDATNTVWTATTNGVSVASGDLIEDGQAVVVVVTPNTGWEYASTPSDWSEGTAGAITRTFTVSGAALGITIPAPTAKAQPPQSDYKVEIEGSDVAITLTQGEIDLFAGYGLTTPELVNGFLAQDFGATGAKVWEVLFLGLDPTDSDALDAFKVNAITLANGTVALTMADGITLQTGRGVDITLNVYGSDDLATWSTTPLATATNETTLPAITPALGESKKFYKVGVVFSATP